MWAVWTGKLIRNTGAQRRRLCSADVQFVWEFTMSETQFYLTLPRHAFDSSLCDEYTQRWKHNLKTPESVHTSLVLSHAKPEQEVSSVISPPNVSLGKITLDAKLLFVTSHIRSHLPVPAVNKRLLNGLSFSNFNKRITQISVNANATCYRNSTERAKLHTVLSTNLKNVYSCVLLIGCCTHLRGLKLIHCKSSYKQKWLSEVNNSLYKANLMKICS